MGPTARHDTVDGSITRRDKEITRLQEELQLCNMRLSQMQTRLLTILDDMDASRTLHQRELEAEKCAKEKLSEKLDRYLDEVRRAEADRDEMREVVSILVDKVEKCNDYSAWPVPHMSLARPLDQLLDHEHIRWTRQEAVRSALLESTLRQLEEERRSHARTREEADAEIFRLRAMIARRDAELEAYATHSGHRELLSGGRAAALPSVVSVWPNRRRGQAQATNDGILSQTIAWQRILEHEVDTLQQQLDQARAADLETNSRHTAAWIDPRARAGAGVVPAATVEIRTSPSLHPDPIPATGRQGGVVASQQLTRQHMFESDPAGQPDETRFELKSSLPGTLSTLGANQADLAAAPTRTAERLSRLYMSVPSSPSLLPQDVPSSPSDYALSPDDASQHSHTACHAAPRPNSHEMVQSADFYSGLDLGGLKQQIDILSTGISAFVIERDAVQRMLSTARSQNLRRLGPLEPVHLVVDGGTAQHTDDDSPPLPKTGSTTADVHLMRDCVKELEVLCQRFDGFVRQSAERERALGAEIDVLRQRQAWCVCDPRGGLHKDDEGKEDERCAPGDLKVPSPSRTCPPKSPAPRVADHIIVQDEATVHGRASAKEDNPDPPSFHATAEEWLSELTEQSMELATPLHPTILSLADEELVIPSLSPWNARTDPASVPLPFSPESVSPDVEASPFSFASTLSPVPPSPSPPTPKPSSSNHPTNVETLRVPADLVARMESVIQARVEAIQREYGETKRELDAKARELEQREVALAKLQHTTSHLQLLSPHNRPDASNTSPADHSSDSIHLPPLPGSN